LQERGDEMQGYKLELDRYGPKSSAMDASIAVADPILALVIIIGMQNTPEGIAAYK
jgi:hypothetical protein